MISDHEAERIIAEAAQYVDEHQEWTLEKRVLVFTRICLEQLVPEDREDEIEPLAQRLAEIARKSLMH